MTVSVVFAACRIEWMFGASLMNETKREVVKWRLLYFICGYCNVFFGDWCSLVVTLKEYEYGLFIDV